MFYKIGDILNPALVGAITGFGVVATIPSDWNMIYGMVFGMFFGMIAQVFFIMIEMPILGAFEAMIPSMIAGMLSGMTNGMLSAMGLLSPAKGFIMGGGLGILVYLWIRSQDLKLKGNVT